MAKGPVRRAYVVRPLPANPARRSAPTLNELKGLHRHGCTVCSHAYQDSCDHALVNGPCTPCHTDHRAPIWETNLGPIECCTNSRPATLDERALYRLGGETTWWICLTCKRAQIFKPREKE